MMARGDLCQREGAWLFSQRSESGNLPAQRRDSMALKAIKTPPLRGKRTKPEIQKEFEEIQDQVEAAREMTDEKSEEVARLREAEVRQSAGLITIESVVQKT